MKDMCCNGQLTVLAGRWDNGFEHVCHLEAIDTAKRMILHISSLRLW